jgi:hypothetical protein
MMHELSIEKSDIILVQRLISSLYQNGACIIYREDLHHFGTAVNLGANRTLQSFSACTSVGKPAMAC